MNTQELQKLLEKATKRTDIVDIIFLLDAQQVVEVLKNYKNILIEKNLDPYHVVSLLSDKDQIELMKHLEETGLTIEEKKLMLANMSKRAKLKMDTSVLPTEYKSAIEMNVSEDIDSYGQIVVDFNEDLEKYRMLDKMLYVDATSISEKDRKRLLELCEICPNMNIYSDMGTMFASNAYEYKNGEAWIQDILKGIPDKWSDMQKIAYIDNCVGKRLSYSPDFNTEVENRNDQRALWKIINTRYGVCNGISEVEKYILNRIGIDSEKISSGRHAFLLLKGVEMPTADGGSIKGDTILDPTWNLVGHKFGAVPENFCKSYEEIRKNDIKENGEDTLSHKNDEKLANGTIGLDRKCLRQIFSSIGLANENGEFPVKDLIDESTKIAVSSLSEEEKLEKELSLLASYQPEFAQCQNETTQILKIVMLNNLKFNKCAVGRVYNTDDEEKKPVLYVFADIKDAGKKFYYADSAGFMPMEQDEFENKFSFYEKDLEKNNGYKPWEDRRNNIEKQEGER